MNNIKNLFLDIVYILVSLAISFVSYLFLFLIISQLLGEILWKSLSYSISIFICVLFSMSLVYTKHFLKANGLKILKSNYEDKEYKGIFKDIIVCFLKNEYFLTFIIIFITIIYALSSSDLIRFAFSPMFMLATKFDSFISYIISLITVLLSYYVYLGIYRKRLYALYCK